MQGDFLFVEIYIFNRIKSYQSGVIIASSKVGDQPLAETVSTLTEDQIKVAADKKTKGIEDKSSAGIFLERV